MTSSALAFMRDHFVGTDRSLCVPRVDGRAHMLCAGYDRRVLGAIDRKIAAGDLQLRRLIEAGDSLVLEESELAAAGYLDAFTNVNTPSEYDRALEIYERQSQS